MDEKRDGSWINVPSTVTAALSTLTSALHEQKGRIQHLERRSDDEGLEAEIQRLSQQQQSMSGTVLDLAAAVERVSDQLAALEVHRREESEALWAALRSTRDEKAVAVERVPLREAAGRRGHGDLTNNEPTILPGLEKRLGRLEAVVEARGAQVETFQKSLDEKLVGAAELNAALARKASWADVEALVAEKADRAAIATLSMGKADAKVVEALASAAASACTKEEARASVKADLALLQTAVRQLETDIRAARRDVAPSDVDGPSSATCRIERGRSQGYGRRTAALESTSISGRRAADEAWVRSVACEEAGRLIGSRLARDHTVEDAARERLVADADARAAEIRPEILAEVSALVEEKSAAIHDRVQSLEKTLNKTAAELVSPVAL